MPSKILNVSMPPTAAPLNADIKPALPVLPVAGQSVLVTNPGSKFAAIPSKVINLSSQHIIPAAPPIKLERENSPLMDKPLFCPECGKLVMSLTAHMRNRHNKVPIRPLDGLTTPFALDDFKPAPKKKVLRRRTCPECGKGFVQLKLHMRTVHKKVLEIPKEKVPTKRKEPEPCPVCGQMYRFVNKHLLLQHNVCLDNPTKLCPTCGKLVGNGTSHVHRREGFFCDLCFVNFKSQELLDQHKQLHEGEHHKCQHCPWIFASLVELAVHNRKHTKQYKCPKCEKTFKTYSALVHHVSREEDAFKYTCEICGKGYSSKHVLLSHLEVHSNEKKHKCRFCDKKFPTRAYLKSHERLNHKKELFGVEEYYQCEYCSRMFNFECSLKRHLKLVHKVGGAKKVQCKVCNKQFTTQYSLTVHTRIHTGEKNYNCSMCEERFHRSQCLTRHMMRRHGVGKKEDKSG